jgi:hypothetical protein
MQNQVSRNGSCIISFRFLVNNDISRSSELLLLNSVALMISFYQSSMYHERFAYELFM